MVYHIAGRPITLGGRKVSVGQPVPESVVTWTLTELGWVLAVTAAEFEAAVEKHGRPPEKLFVGWDFAPNGKPPAEGPRRRKKTTAKARKKAKRRKARAR